MLRRFTLLLMFPLLLPAATHWILIRTSEGAMVEGQTTASGFVVEAEGRPVKLSLNDLLSVHSAAPATAFEKQRIAIDLEAVPAKDRKASDRAVEELTSIGLPVLTPVLTTLRDTDQHEPHPLYRLVGRIIPGYADGPDRSLSLIRLQNGSALRGTLPAGAIDVRQAGGASQSVPWSSIRSLAVRQKMVRRAMPVDSLRHCTRIEYLDSGVVIGPQSRLDITAQGFARLAFNEDGWSSDPDGLKKPGSPAYKTNLVDGHPFGALVGRVGAAGEVFVVGRKFSNAGLPVGRLGLAINDNAHWQNNVGSYSLTMAVTDAYDVGDPR